MFGLWYSQVSSCSGSSEILVRNNSTSNHNQESLLSYYYPENVFRDPEIFQGTFVLRNFLCTASVGQTVAAS